MFNLFKKKSKESPKLFYHTDMHCHILPGVDHGSQNIDQSLEMLRAEIDMGISHVILTSHVTAETFENTPETLTAAFETLKKAVEEEGLPVDLDVSAEYRIDEYWNILAHPERYRYYYDRKDRYKSLHSASVKFQVNILSLEGYFGRGARETALWLIDNNLCDMLGSDMHSMDHAHIIQDYIASREWRKLCEKYDLLKRIINDREFVQR